MEKNEWFCIEALNSPILAEDSDKSINFGLPRKYDAGTAPSIAVNRNGRIIEVHQSESHKTLWYHIGDNHINYLNVDFGPSRKLDNGRSPDVAINDMNVVVEVHQSDGYKSLFCHVGEHSGGDIIWGASYKYDNGVQPSIAINNECCIEVHKSESHDTLWRHIGIVQENKTIVWGGVDSYDRGIKPEIALNNKGICVEVHQSEGYNTIWCRIGKINVRAKSVDFGSSMKIADGKNPAVAVTDNNIAFISFEHAGKVSTLHMYIEPESKNFTRVYCSDLVCNPSYSCPRNACSSDASIALQVGYAGNEIHYCSSLIIDRTYWLSDIYEVIKDRAIKQITFVASHDTGAYKLDDVHDEADPVLKNIPAFLLADKKRTQSLDIYSQLCAGARYLDLRVWFTSNEFYTVHNLRAASMKEILAQLKRFMEAARLSGKKELVFVKVAMFENFSEEQYLELKNLLLQYLKDYVYKKSVSDLPDTMYKDVVGDSCRAIILFDVNKSVNYKDGIHFAGDLKLYDCYSNTTDYEVMKNDQLQKYANYCREEIQANMFLLSWTLTYLFKIGTLFDSLEDLADAANTHLGDIFGNEDIYAMNNKRINFIYTDFLQKSRATDYAILLNAKRL